MEAEEDLAISVAVVVGMIAGEVEDQVVEVTVGRAVVRLADQVMINMNIVIIRAHHVDLGILIPISSVGKLCRS